MRRRVLAMVAALDEGVGNITSTLRNEGLWDDTILVFTSDNGSTVAYLLRLSKQIDIAFCFKNQFRCCNQWVVR